MGEIKDMSIKMEMVNKIPEGDTRDILIMEIEALEAFTPEERQSVFGSDTILWIVKNFTVNELKSFVKKFAEKSEVKVGDTVHVRSSNGEWDALVLSVYGMHMDRLNLLYKDENEYLATSGVSVYDVQVTGHVEIEEVLNAI